jgi:DcaP outer membrane protein
MRHSEDIARVFICATLALLAAVFLPVWSLAQEPEKPAAPSAPADSKPAEPPPSAEQATAAEQKPAPAGAPTLEELQRQIAELKALLLAQQALIEAQKKKMASQDDALGEQRKKLDELQRTLESTTRRLDELQGELPSAESQKAMEERLKRVEKTADKTPELPPNVVSAGDFPGSIRIPGTDAAVKFGGRVRVAVVATLDPLGSVDRFLTNSIPVGPPPPGLSDQETNINANSSRFNFEMRTPTGAGQMRAFIEGDFFGTNNSFRLRHAYGQFHGVLAGQTWSTFSDPAANHEDLDFEGVSSENVVRQPQIRYTWLPTKTLSVAASIETPKIDVTDGVGSEVIPDVVGRLIWNYKKNAHLQGSVVFRQIRAAPLTDPQAFQQALGWGASLSGVFPFERWNLTDRFIFQINVGQAIARYINDLSSQGGLDGIFDPANGELKVLKMGGWYLDYEHMWKHWELTRDMNLRSSLIWSVVKVDNLDFQPAEAYHLTHRLAANVIFSPMARMDAGLQYIWGTRKNNDGETGDARQVQLVVIFRF